ncbi:MAG TPA: glycine--tRNA ligase subunit beta [Fimbriimonadaceae bacterium]|nr:glycine--tRNA ligase subunit beta [Fimbriimonadaceae bacterium]HRJ96151.1 glycine--tRNA ligase subunit beta [Fimbriimonadaceae bacterium]
MPDLLFELGCEELPATFVRKAYAQLVEEIISRLDEAGIAHGEATSMGTPRRLIVGVADVAERQPDRSVEQRGPSVKAAFDDDGNPTQALLGFCRGQGVDPSLVRKEGDYVWVDKSIAGRRTHEVLAEILPEAVRSLSFEKSMRWGSSRMRFARPIRWLLAAFDGGLVDFDIEGLRSGLTSRGHRFNYPEPFEARSLDDLVAGLRQREVEPDPALREKRIREGAVAVCSGKPQLDDALVDENVFLTEWPTAVEGIFGEDYLALPEPVLVTAMAKHERMFPVRNGSGALTNRFIAIRNAGVEEVVREGNAWVLNARFNDAKFFFDEDAKSTLEDFLERSSRITFQEKLGSIRQRAERLASLAHDVAVHTGADDDERALAERAALYAKADLASGLVSELPSLQGVIGGEYARREGFDPAVCHAIATQYDLKKNSEPRTPDQRTAVRVTIADQLDKLAGYLGLGLAPSGSSDPYGLRRAATLLIEAAWQWPEPLPSYLEMVRFALDRYERQGIGLDHRAAEEHLSQIFSSRYEALFDDARHDLLEAAMLPSLGQLLLPRQVRLRLQVQEVVSQDPAFVRTLTRPINILAAAEKKGVSFASEGPLEALDRKALDSAEGVALAGQLLEVRQGLSDAVRAEDPARVATILGLLRAPIDAFFDSTMVMADDEQVRFARLTLLEAARHDILLGGDFSKVVIEG